MVVYEKKQNHIFSRYEVIKRIKRIYLFLKRIRFYIDFIIFDCHLFNFIPFFFNWNYKGVLGKSILFGEYYFFVERSVNSPFRFAHWAQKWTMPRKTPLLHWQQYCSIRSKKLLSCCRLILFTCDTFTRLYFSLLY